VEDGSPIAYGLAVVERGMVGLFDIVTVSEARRRGAGRLLVKSLLAWGRRRAPRLAIFRYSGPTRWHARFTAAPAFARRTGIITACARERQAGPGGYLEGS